jgi:hypothetical protein
MIDEEAKDIVQSFEDTHPKTYFAFEGTTQKIATSHIAAADLDSDGYVRIYVRSTQDAARLLRDRYREVLEKRHRLFNRKDTHAVFVKDGAGAGVVMAVSNGCGGGSGGGGAGAYPNGIGGSGGSPMPALVPSTSGWRPAGDNWVPKADLEEARRELAEALAMSKRHLEYRNVSNKCANQLSDEAGNLRHERDELLRENAVLRRTVERLERKKR